MADRVMTSRLGCGSKGGSVASMLVSHWLTFSCAGLDLFLLRRPPAPMTQTFLHPTPSSPSLSSLLLPLKAEVREERSISQISEVTVTKVTERRLSRRPLGLEPHIDLRTYSERTLFISKPRYLQPWRRSITHACAGILITAAACYVTLTIN